MIIYRSKVIHFYLPQLENTMTTEAEKDTKNVIKEREETKVVAAPVKLVLFRGMLLTEEEARDWDDK